jgi:hypothetical protein
MGSTVTVGSQGTRPSQPIKPLVRMGARPPCPCPCPCPWPTDGVHILSSSTRLFSSGVQAEQVEGGSPWEERRAIASRHVGWRGHVAVTWSEPAGARVGGVALAVAATAVIPNLLRRPDGSGFGAVAVTASEMGRRAGRIRGGTPDIVPAPPLVARPWDGAGRAPRLRPPSLPLSVRVWQQPHPYPVSVWVATACLYHTRAKVAPSIPPIQLFEERRRVGVDREVAGNILLTAPGAGEHVGLGATVLVHA